MLIRGSGSSSKGSSQGLVSQLDGVGALARLDKGLMEERERKRERERERERERGREREIFYGSAFQLKASH